MRKIILNENQIKSLNENKYVVYHGSDEEFEDFNYDKISTGAGAWHGAGFYFSDSEGEAKLYGHNVKQYQIQLKNPIDFTKIKDTSMQGSGFVRYLVSLKGFDDLKYKGKTLKQLVAILDEIEENYDEDKVDYSEGTRDWFKHVWYKHGNEEFSLKNRNEHEIKDKKYIKSLFVGQILDRIYGIDSLPIMVKDLTNPFVFTQIAKKNGYDGIIAHNSTLPTGNEYVVFDKKNIF